MLPRRNENPIQTARIAKGWTQLELAMHPKVRVSLSTIRLAERGAATARTLSLLAEALGLDPAALTAELRGEGVARAG